MDTEALYAPYKEERTRIFNERISNDQVYPHIGVRIPILRKLAKGISPDDIPIRYHEDVTLKGLAIAEMKAPLSEKLDKLDNLLPFLSAWDHTDVIASSFAPKKGERDEALSYFTELLKDARPFPRRLGIVYLMSHRKDYEDQEALLKAIAGADSAEYYISMAVAWALSFFYIDNKDRALPYFEKVSEQTRKRAWQKVRDSRRTK